MITRTSSLDSRTGQHDQGVEEPGRGCVTFHRR